jgi:glycosyltransferase involved in cell wall biosynthesis
MKLSVVIPTYTINKELEDLAHLALISVQKADEIIVTEDGGTYNTTFYKDCDIYVYARNAGFTANVNRGIKLSHGDYIAVMNSDTRVAKGDIFDLCIPDRVSCPRTRGQDVPLLAGHFFVIPRTILDEVGMLDERLKMFCSDADFEQKIKDRIVHVDSVVIDHEINATLNAAKTLETGALERDRKIYASFSSNTNNS